METKQFEIRDRGTFIPALAVRVSGTDGYLMRRAGFDNHCVYLIHLEAETCAYDPFNWGSPSRTMQVAHLHIEQHWDELVDEDVIDVEYLLNETETKKVSERVTTGS